MKLYIKSISMKVVLIISGIIISFGCHNEYVNPETQDMTLYTNEVYVIGIDPCTADYPIGLPQKGYVLQIVGSEDTLATYNLPVETARIVDASVSPLENGYLLPAKIRGSFKIRITYRYAEDKEKVYPLCRANIDLSGFSKVNTNQVVIQ